MLILKRGNYYINFLLRSNIVFCFNKIIMVYSIIMLRLKKKVML